MPILLFVPLLLDATPAATTIVEADPTAWLRGALLGGLITLGGLLISAVITVQVKRFFDQRDKLSDKHAQEQKDREETLRTVGQKIVSIEAELKAIKAEITEGQEESSQVRHIAEDAGRRATFNEGRFLGFESHLVTIENLAKAALAQIRETS